MCLPKKCCCCYKLYTGGIILGYLGCISSVACLTLGFWYFLSLEQVNEFLTGRTREMYDSQPLSDIMLKFQLFMLMIFFILNMFELGSSICLIVGTVKNKPLLLVPWMVSEGSKLLYSVIFLFLYSLEIFGMEFWIIFGLINIAFDTYRILCIYALFAKMEKEKAALIKSVLVIEEVKDEHPDCESLV